MKKLVVAGMLAFALTHQTATGRNKAGAVFLCLVMQKMIREQGVVRGT